MLKLPLLLSSFGCDFSAARDFLLSFLGFAQVSSLVSSEALDPSCEARP